MKQLNFILILFMVLSCNSTRKSVTLTVASQQVDCQGEGIQKCLLIKREKQKDWEYFYNEIEGFTYESGFEYVLEIEEESIANPPADGSSIKYKLVKQISKTKK